MSNILKMSSRKTFQLRIKPLKHDSDDQIGINLRENSLTSDGDDASQEDRTSGEEEAEPENEHDKDSQDIEQVINTISFGALARVQEGLSGKPKLNATDDDDSDSSRTNPRGVYTDAEAEERKAGKMDRRDFSRSSKHAPAEISSKKAVSRRREVVSVKKLDHRDPRFEPLNGPVDEAKVKKKYSFLDSYRDSEMAELQAAILKSKDFATTEKLKRALRSMESRKKTQVAKEQEQAVLTAHRAREKELVRQGKKPFYLKRGEQKKLALVERFEGLKGKQIDRIIERRRKKKTARERKGMPEGRRM